MNYLLICPKTDTKLYTLALQNVHNISVLGSINLITEEKTIKIIKEKYNPHSIFIVDNFVFKDSQNYRTIDLIKDIKKECTYAKIYYLNVACNEDTKQQLNDLLIYNILTRTVTDREFANFIENGFSSKKDEEEFNQRAVSTNFKDLKPQKQSKLKINPIFIIAIIFILFTVILVALKVGTGEQKPIEPTDQTSPSAPTTSSEVATEVEEPTLETLGVMTEPPTQTPTSAPTTEPITDPPTSKPTNNTSGGSSNNGGNTTTPTTNPPPATTPVVTSPPVTTPPATTPPATVPIIKTTITPTSTTLKVGDVFNIKVSGTNTSKGINWSIDNKAVISFVSADLTKVTIKANAEGVAVVTGVLKSNGEIIQCIVTVEE